MRPNIIITMAGQGQRFRDVGYQIPKYEIEVNGQTLFWWAMDSLRSFYELDPHVFFIARKAFTPEAFINRECKKLGISNFQVVLLDALTRGQASTVLESEQAGIEPHAPVIVYNIDTHVNPKYLKPDFLGADGWIPCFPGPGNGWSFVRVDAKNVALEVQEKVRISEHASIGLYGFASFLDYKHYYQKYYELSENSAAKEFYIAPLYNQLIQEGKQIHISTLPLNAVHPLGTPEEVQRFQECLHYE